MLDVRIKWYFFWRDIFVLNTELLELSSEILDNTELWMGPGLAGQQQVIKNT